MAFVLPVHGTGPELLATKSQMRRYRPVTSTRPAWSRPCDVGQPVFETLIFRNRFLQF